MLKKILKLNILDSEILIKYIGGKYMEGRRHKETGIFEVFYNNEWHQLTDLNWEIARKEISLNFIMALCYKSNEKFKKYAFCELDRRIKNDFNLNELWILFLQGSRLVGDLAIDEIFKRSGVRYCLPVELNR